MGLSLKPEHLRRYRDMAALLLKYGRSDMVFTAGLDMDEPEPDSPSGGYTGDKLAGDLEALGPTFVKMGQLLSSRADLLSPDALRALSRLQDDVTPFPFEDVSRYGARRVRDRFTFELLESYLSELGLSPFDEKFYLTDSGRAAHLVELHGPPPAGLREYSLPEAAGGV